MDVDLWSQIFVILLLIGVNAFFAASEMAIVSIRQSKLRPLIDEGNKSAKIVDRFIEEPSKLLATIQVGVTFAGFFASGLGAQTLAPHLGRVLEGLNIPILVAYANTIAFLTITIIISYVTLVLGELVPKRLALGWSDKIALFVARPILFFSKLAFPIVRLLTVSTNFVVKLLGGESKDYDDDLTKEEIRLMINAGEEKGIIR